MKLNHLNVIGACIITIFPMLAEAQLLSRLGGLAVYDTDLDITWLADANAGVGSAWDTNSADGRMDWFSANGWVASLTVGGFTDWRLPTALNQDGSGPCHGFNCTDSEMGHLFYNELGGTPGSWILDSEDPDLALFHNIQTLLLPGIPIDRFNQVRYWSGTEVGYIPDRAWDFDFLDGFQDGGMDKGVHYFVWAVRSGDVSEVPIPGTVWLFLSGLLGLVGIARSKKMG